MAVTLVYAKGHLHPETETYVRGLGDRVEWHEIPAGPGPWFPDWLRAQWRQPGDWIVWEQDVIPPPGAIEELFSCPEFWCTYPEMNLGSYITTAFGFAKFSAAFKAAYPELMDRSLGWNRWQFPGPCLKPGEIDPSPSGRPDLWPSDPTWFARDALFAREAHKLRIREHVHQPPLTHFRSHGGTARPGEGVEVAAVRRFPRFNDLLQKDRTFPDRQRLDQSVGPAQQGEESVGHAVDAPVVGGEPALGSQ